jgi:hypothetical protein
VNFTDADTLLRETLCWKIRVLSREQAVRLFALAGVSSARAAKRRLHMLTRLRLVACEELLARPLLTLDAPLVRWRPGEAPADFEALAWTLEKRWQTPLEPTRVFFAGRETVRIFGGCAKGHLTNVNQVSHDLHVAEVYLQFLENDRHRAGMWVSEDELSEHRKKFEKQPDAVLHDEAGVARLVVEFGGLYGPEKLRAFHSHMDHRNLPYELW